MSLIDPDHGIRNSDLKTSEILALRDWFRWEDPQGREDLNEGLTEDEYYKRRRELALLMEASKFNRIPSHDFFYHGPFPEGIETSGSSGDEWGEAASQAAVEVGAGAAEEGAVMSDSEEEW